VELIGFDDLKEKIIKSYHNNKLHHAILIDGQDGCGKKSLALELANQFTNSQNETNPDILLVQKELTKKEITIDKIRNIFSFATQTSAKAKDKFIIIDSACNLNKSSANALLKILEEPRPNNYLFLISHNLNKVLPTIKSRCLILKSQTLSQEDFEQIVKQNSFDISSQDLEFLCEITNYSPATIINHGQDILRVYELFLRSILNNKISNNLLKIIADKNFDFDIFKRIYEFFYYRLTKYQLNSEFKTFFEEQEVFSKLKNKSSLEKLFNNYATNISIINKTKSLYLSKELSFTNIFDQLCYD